jgi:putative ABC transport system permease protein
MKFFPLLAANLLRRKVRTTLTLGSFVVALFLYGLLVTIRFAFAGGVEAAGADRLIIINKVSIIQPLPLAYRQRILRVPGIKEITYASWFGGVYQDEKNFFAQFAVDHKTWRYMYPEFILPDEQWAAFAANRTACVVGEVTAERFGWKVGDRIPIRGVIFSGAWEFDLVGIYKVKRPQDDASQFFFRWDYLSEKGPLWNRGNVGWYVARMEPDADAVRVSKAIDEAFANSTAETRAQSEKFFMTSWLKQMGNIEFLMVTIGAVVFFTLLLVTGNTMAMSVRERTAELAVLKAIGYSDRFVLSLVLLEALLIAVIGGGAGIAGAKIFTTVVGDPTGGMLPIFYLPAFGIVVGGAITLGIGLVAGALPALTAMRLQVVEALRRY